MADEANLASKTAARAHDAAASARSAAAVAATATAPAPAPGGAEDAAATASMETLWLLLDGKQILLVAQPPPGLSHQVLIELAICRMLDVPPPASLAALLTCAPAATAATLEQLRVVAPPKRLAPSSGSPVRATDEPMLRLRPLRSFFAGEIVALQADGGEGFVYARVDEACAADESGRGFVQLRLGERGLQRVPALSVYSFNSNRVSPQRGVAATHADTAGTIEWAGATMAPSHVAEAGASQGPSLELDAAAFVSAVATVLERANLPIDVERQELLSHNLALRDEVSQANRERELALDESSRALKELDELREANTCQICLNNKIDTLLVGCGHLRCSACVDQVNLRCPFCRAHFDGVAKFYHAR